MSKPYLCTNYAEIAHQYEERTEEQRGLYDKMSKEMEKCFDETSMLTDGPIGALIKVSICKDMATRREAFYEGVVNDSRSMAKKYNLQTMECIDRYWSENKEADSLRGAIKFSVESPCAEAETKLSDGELYNMAVSKAISKIDAAYCFSPSAGYTGPTFINNWLVSDFRKFKCGQDGKQVQIDITFQEGGSVECDRSREKFVVNDGTKMIGKEDKEADFFRDFLNMGLLLFLLNNTPVVPVEKSDTEPAGGKTNS